MGEHQDLGGHTRKPVVFSYLRINVLACVRLDRWQSMLRQHGR